MCLFFLQERGEYSNVSASSSQNSGEYSKVLFVCLCLFVSLFVCLFVLPKSGEYSNVSVSPLQPRDKYSKVVFVCLFVCLFVCVFVRFTKKW